MKSSRGQIRSNVKKIPGIPKNQLAPYPHDVFTIETLIGQKDKYIHTRGKTRGHNSHRRRQRSRCEMSEMSLWKKMERTKPDRTSEGGRDRVYF